MNRTPSYLCNFYLHRLRAAILISAGNFIRNFPCFSKIAYLAVLSLALFPSTPTKAIVALSDGFGDGDLNNDGTSLGVADTDIDGTQSQISYVPGRLIDGSGNEPTNSELTVVENPNDIGIRWLQSQGWNNAVSSAHPGSGESRPTIRIVDDSQGAMLETQNGVGGLGIPAIDSGNAMAWESRGGGSSAIGFFDENIALGNQVGDEVKVSFDFRIWRDAPNLNSESDTNNSPDFGELRFGLYQDTDNQLGQTNPFAGQQVDSNGSPLIDPFNDFQSAVWGQEEGLFDGSLTGEQGSGDDVGTHGDAGWSASVIMGEHVLSNGGLSRVREEVQSDRILQGGDVQTIAQPENFATGIFDPPIYDFINMDFTKVYNLSLSLKRATEITEGDTIYAELSITDLVTLETFSLGGQDDLSHAIYPGIQSDSWDYFALRNASSGGGEYDFILDNFLLEVNGSNEGDYVPEPTSLIFTTLAGTLLSLPLRRRA